MSDGAADLIATARAVSADLEPLPLPGRGTTTRRWQAFADLAMRDLSLVRLVEGHFDAQAILTELGGPPPVTSGLLGVWAARPAELRATRHGDVWRLDGTKPFCSGSSALDQALVTATAEDGVRLFLVDGAQPSPRPGSWRPLGMAATVSDTLAFEGLRVPDDRVVGAPGTYVDRPGFGHGGCGGRGRAGGAALSALLRDIRDRLRSGATDGQLARFAAVTVAVDGAAGALRIGSDRDRRGAGRSGRGRAVGRPHAASSPPRPHARPWRRPRRCSAPRWSAPAPPSPGGSPT